MATHQTINELLSAYRSGATTPQAELDRIAAARERTGASNVWLHTLTRDDHGPYLDELAKMSRDDAPLWGVPMAIKDNIDLAGTPTTAACPAYGYTPDRSATVVQRLLAAGALPVGKTNLDQFATGLVGTRSPHGAVPNSVHPDYISGGSSSGSAVAVALGQATFGLGTDTAGSGRVPAAFKRAGGLQAVTGLVVDPGSRTRLSHARLRQRVYPQRRRRAPRSGSCRRLRCGRSVFTTHEPAGLP